MQQQVRAAPEWLETNGLGGFSSGTVSGPRTRRYHALLLVGTDRGRFVLISGFDASVETDQGVFPISCQYYSPGVVSPSGALGPSSFKLAPWPRWTFELPTGTRIEQELFVPHRSAMVAMSWRVIDGPDDVRLSMRPFIAGRDYHELMQENDVFCFDGEMDGKSVTWHPYPGVPAIQVCSNAEYIPASQWYRNFLYLAETERGLDNLEDLASPGVFRWTLSRDPAVWLAAAETGEETSTTMPSGASSVPSRYQWLKGSEKRRRAMFPDGLARAADDYLIKSGNRETIIAGYPWFSDWGRDTFIALRGLCLAADRLDEAEAILGSWAEHVSGGMLPNRFPDRGAPPQYNSVDASLWYTVAVSDFLQKSQAVKRLVSEDRVWQLNCAVEKILEGYAAGTRYSTYLDDDGLLACGEPNVQITWMDAKVGDWVVTPRVGKPVEVQALWLNALHIGSRWSRRWQQLYEFALASFRDKFWNEELNCLYDVIDVGHQRGELDDSVRPNQVFAVGGLPQQSYGGERAKMIVRVVEQHLWTPLGLRTLSARDRRYRGRYQGGVWERDGAYHQGTAWPWLLGPFVEAWVRVQDGTAEAKTQAYQRFVSPLESHRHEAGLGHISEITDGDPPYTPRGCPFQAWSLGELIRLKREVLGSGSAQEMNECSSNAERDERNKQHWGWKVDQATLQTALRSRVDERTHRRVRDLQLEIHDGELLIHGQAPSFHVKQLAEVVARELVTLHGLQAVKSHIKVKNDADV